MGELVLGSTRHPIPPTNTLTYTHALAVKSKPFFRE